MQFQLQGWLVPGDKIIREQAIRREKATGRVLGGGVSATRSDYTCVTK